MKKTLNLVSFILILGFPMSLKAQFGEEEPAMHTINEAKLVYFGLKGGVGASLYTNPQQTSFWLSSDAGYDGTVSDPANLGGGVVTWEDEEISEYFGWQAGFYTVFRPSHFGFLKAELLYAERGWEYENDRVRRTFGYLDVPVSLGFAYKSLQVFGGLQWSYMVKSEVDEDMEISGSTGTYSQVLPRERDVDFYSQNAQLNWHAGIGLVSDYFGLELRFVQGLEGIDYTDQYIPQTLELSLLIQSGMFKPFHAPYQN